MSAKPSRRLVVLRHAKSAWPDVPDRERPLAGRGRRDAPAVGRWLRKGGYLPDLVACSPARRTRETWELVAAELGRQPEPDVDYDERIYDASVPDLLDVLRDTPPGTRTLLLIGHNPGVQALTVTLAATDADADADDTLARVRTGFPTSAVAVLTLDVPWAELTRGNATLTDIAAPRGARR